MVASLGYFSLLIALIISAGGLFAALAGMRDEGLVDWAKLAVRLSFGLLSVAVLAMLCTLLTHDFSLAYVAQYSGRETSQPTAAACRRSSPISLRALSETRAAGGAPTTDRRAPDEC